MYDGFNPNFMSKLAEAITYIVVLVFAFWFIKTAIILIPEILKFP
jgi:hypothetical protein